MGMLCSYGMSYNAIPSAPVPPDAPSDTILKRGRPLAGAATLYHHKQYYAHQPIRSGSEIFVDYGESSVVDKSWYTQRPEIDEEPQDIGKLMRTGFCLDHIRPGPSAYGQGAVATRFLPSGTVIAPLPVLAVNRTSLDMTVGTALPDRSRPHHQLLINYCFGHPDSTLLLYPYSPVSNYINHGNPDNMVNAYVRWSSESPNLDQAVEMTAADVLESRHPLLLEVVASRDILPGEEVAIDYGNIWRTNFERHLATFDASRHGNFRDYAYSTKFNDEEMYKPVLTWLEQRAEPYPMNLETSCYYKYEGSKDPAVIPWPDPSFDPGARVTTATWTLPAPMIRSGQSSGRFPVHLHHNPALERHLRPCHILDRITVDESHGEEERYTVEIKNPGQHFESGDPMTAHLIPSGERHIVTNMPRAAIRFTDRIYTTDQNLPNAFRHEIGLPTGVFPDSWLDIRYR